MPSPLRPPRTAPAPRRVAARARRRRRLLAPPHRLRPRARSCGHLRRRRGAGGAYAAWALVCRGGGCPSVAGLEGYSPRQTSKLFAADGRFVGEIGNERRTLVTVADIPPVVREAFLVTEDKRFYRTPASTGCASRARCSGTCARDAVARGLLDRSRCSSRATSSPRTSRARRRSSASSARPRSRARSSAGIRRTRSSSSTSTRSISAPARTASRPRRSATSARASAS